MRKEGLIFLKSNTNTGIGFLSDFEQIHWAFKSNPLKAKMRPCQRHFLNLHSKVTEMSSCAPKKEHTAISPF